MTKIMKPILTKEVDGREENNINLKIIKSIK